MSEKVSFSIPQPTEGEDNAYEVLWYQSSNGEIWDSIPIDIILASNLLIDTSTGKFIWESLLADENKYHQIRTRTQDGIESVNGLTIPPRVISEGINKESSVIADRIFDGIGKYKIGENIELVLNIDKNISNIIGDVINIEIMDYFYNVLAIIQANRVSDTVYLAEYTIPKNLGILFNPYKEQYPAEDYILIDRWLLPDSTSLEYKFIVENKIKENVILPNCEFNINISNINGYNIDKEVKFTSKLDPYHCSVQDVVDIFPNYLSKLDPFIIARTIMEWSKIIDLHYKPDTIWYRDRFDNAVRNLTAYQTAQNLLSFETLNIESETRTLDTFTVSRQYNLTNGIKNQITSAIEKFSNIVWAGGKDTPFIAKTFVKGVFDPNRPDWPRTNIDVNDPYPFVNTNSSSFVITGEDGNVVEVRGSRTISYRYYVGQNYVRQIELI